MKDIKKTREQKMKINELRKWNNKNERQKKKKTRTKNGNK